MSTPARTSVTNDLQTEWSAARIQLRSELGLACGNWLRNLSLVHLDEHEARFEILCPFDRDIALKYFEKIARALRVHSITIEVCHSDVIGKATPKPSRIPESDVINAIQKCVSAHYAVKIKSMLAQWHSRKASDSRRIAIYLACKLTNESFDTIGQQFGGRRSLAVRKSRNQVERQCETDPDFRRTINHLTELLAAAP